MISIFTTGKLVWVVSRWRRENSWRSVAVVITAVGDGDAVCGMGGGVDQVGENGRGRQARQR